MNFSCRNGLDLVQYEQAREIPKRRALELNILHANKIIIIY